MTVQFFVALLLFGLAVGLTAQFWLRALVQIEFRKVANFYRHSFIVLATCLAALIWAQAFALIEPAFGFALMQGTTSAFVLFILFAWGRLTALGLKFDATHLT